MSDLALAWPLADPYADLAVVDSDLAGDGDGLRTAIIVSLFSDARAGLDELPPGESDRRGWWGDLLDDDGEAGIGSKLWLIAREKETREVALRAAAYAREALQWLRADGVVRAIGVAAEWISAGVLELSIGVTTADGAEREWTFDWRVRGA